MENTAIESTVEQTANEMISYAAKWSAVQVKDRTHYGDLSEELRFIKSKAKELDTLRKDMTRPLDESKKRIMAFFDSPLKALSKAEFSIKTAMVAFDAQERAKEEEARRKAEAERRAAEELQRKSEAEARAKNAPPPPPLPENVEIVSTPVHAKGVSFTTVWKFEIQDESLIPREWLTPDTTKIGQAVRGAKDALNIPGVRIYSEKVVSAKRY